ncbi:hypothetical protein GCM10008955_13740 [Deinococcus malanensis]|uniref:DUF3445 domain-containing protein n=1 Tax=Deinococcus malanensis TaxID=1706855 RepID=A0ABQ2EQI1_9DEIO|nr:DUF3445 domain-containing protein [Deinococcus malanensis]GGK21536.1 hypothetical protein GCM10008955_13740 [Deinococcus malanensis]
MRPPTLYRPFMDGRYSVSAGLFRLGVQPIPWREDGEPERHTFTLDREYPRFVASKVAAHRRALYQYSGEAGLTPDLREAVLTHVAGALAADSDGAVHWNGQTLRNDLLGWEVDLDTRWGAVGTVRRFPAPHADLVQEVRPFHALDFLGLNAQEDLAIVARDEQGDWLAAAHVLSPQHWDPRDKLGRDFVAVHTPVAGSGLMNATAPRLVDAVITRGPFVRFAWGLSMSNRLDHHPAAPPDADRHADTRFDPEQAFLRVERQTLTGFPQADGALFTIRPLTTPLRESVVTAGQAHALAEALRSMTPDQIRYKGLETILHDALSWLSAQAIHSDM